MNGGISSGRTLNRLSDKSVQKFVREAKQGKASSKKLGDGGGLFVTLTPAGTPVWRIKYRLGGKERIYAVGEYQQITLEQARAKRGEVKNLLKEGRDPVQARRLGKAANTAASEDTFSRVAEDWLAKQRKDWSRIHYSKSSRALERDVIPKIGKLPVKDITPAMVAHTIEAIADRGAIDTAKKVLQHVGGIFRLAQARGLRDDNPSEAAHEVLPKNRQPGRMPALLSFVALGDVLRGADAARLSPSVRMAHRLCAFTVARISNIVQAEWREFSLEGDKPTWVIPRKKMKAHDRPFDHKIFLCPTLTDELTKWRETIGGNGFVFPSPAGGKHITRESLEKCYRVTLGLANKHSPHGWRSAFSTLARDDGHERDVVELALDHIHDNDVVRAYDRGERQVKRIKLMTWWGDQLSQAQRGAEVVTFSAKRA